MQLFHNIPLLLIITLLDKAINGQTECGGKRSTVIHSQEHGKTTSYCKQQRSTRQRVQSVATCLPKVSMAGHSHVIVVKKQRSF